MSSRPAVVSAECLSRKRRADGDLLLGFGAVLSLAAGNLLAAEIGPVKVGAGVRTSFNVMYDADGYNSGGDESDGFYVLGSYLFPQLVGPGRIQILGKYSTVDHEFGTTTIQDEGTEVNPGYVMKAFNAQAYPFYLDKTFDSPVFTDFKTYGLGLQLQM